MKLMEQTNRAMMDRAATSIPFTKARAATMIMLKAMEMVPMGKDTLRLSTRETMSKPPVDAPLRMTMDPRAPLRTAPKMTLMRGMTGFVISKICGWGRFSKTA